MFFSSCYASKAMIAPHAWVYITRLGRLAKLPPSLHCSGTISAYRLFFADSNSSLA
jgi:hypothetical protein